MWPSKQSVPGKCFAQNFFGNFFFVLKFKVSTLIIVSHITKLGFGTATVLFPTLTTFYKAYCVFEIAIKWFANVINFVRIAK